MDASLRPPGRSGLLAFLAAALLYAALGWLGFLFPSTDPAANPVWPAAGAGIAVAVLAGRRHWLPTALGTFLGALALWMPGLGPAAGAALALLAGALTFVGAWAIERFARGRAAVDSVPGLFLLGTVSALLALLAAGLVVALRLAAGVPVELAPALFSGRFMGTLGGLMLVLPPAFAFAKPWGAADPDLARRSTWLQAYAIAAVMGAYIGYQASAPLTIPQAFTSVIGFVAIGALVWGSLTFSARGSLLLSSLLSAISLLSWMTGHLQPTQTLQGQLGSWGLTVTVILLLFGPLGMLVGERRAVQNGLAQAVRDRTRDLQESETRFRALAESAPVGIFHTDANGKLDFVNPRWVAIAGRPLEQANESIHPDDAAAVQSAWSEVVAAGGIIDMEFRFIRPDHTMGWVHTRAEPTKGPDGAVTGWIGTVSDITQQREHETKMREAKEAAEAAAQAKSAFLATMSHEIRTPLNAVLGIAQLMDVRSHDAEERNDVNTIRTSAEHLLTIINDILDFSKGEAGKIHVEQIPVDLRRVGQEAIALIQSRVSPLVPITLHCGEAAPFLGDPNRLRQVLLNYISNAVKFTPHGQIDVTLASRPSAGGVDVEVQVRDSGIGIAPERLAELFQPFQQLDSSFSRKYEGTGLGLAITKRIIEAFGGRVWAESTPGKGSTFYARFAAAPAQLPAASPTRPTVPRPPRPLRILVAEDNAVNRMVALKMLASLGQSADVVADGEQAVAQVKRRTYDVVLMDVHMPVLDGLAATRRIRADGNGPIIIAMTADALAEDRQKCLDAGMNDYLSKPVRLEELAQKLAELKLPAAAA